MPACRQTQMAAPQRRSADSMPLRARAPLANQRESPSRDIHIPTGNQAALRGLRTASASGWLPATLTVEPAASAHEQEADHASARVTGTSERQLQRKYDGANSAPQTTAPASVHQALNSPGQALDTATRRSMESHFGRDFSSVRIHADNQATASAKAVRAQAYAYGNDIVFQADHYSPQTAAGRSLIAHELAHVVQQSTSSGPVGIQRKPEPPKFGSCAAIGDPLADIKVENGRKQAINFVEVTIRDLKRSPSDPAASNTYRQALKTHFANPGDTDRATIRENYQGILSLLRNTTHIVCASTKADMEECKKATNPLGFVRPGEKTINLCPVFMDDSITCRAILLIHEAAHTLGIGAKPPHPPYRGAAEYPGPEKSIPAGQTTAIRMDNPDAYGYFAANIWRETDTWCLPALKLDMVIEVHDTAPPTK